MSAQATKVIITHKTWVKFTPDNAQVEWKFYWVNIDKLAAQRSSHLKKSINFTKINRFWNNIQIILVVWFALFAQFWLHVLIA